MKDYALLMDLKTKGGVEFKKGEKVTLSFEENCPTKAVFSNGKGRIKIKVAIAHKAISGFPKPPSLKALEKMAEDGIAKTVLGERTEPDGWDTKGSPSWIMALGFM